MDQLSTYSAMCRERSFASENLNAKIDIFYGSVNPDASRASKQQITKGQNIESDSGFKNASNLKIPDQRIEERKGSSRESPQKLPGEANPQPTMDIEVPPELSNNRTPENRELTINEESMEPVEYITGEIFKPTTKIKLIPQAILTSERLSPPPVLPSLTEEFSHKKAKAPQQRLSQPARLNNEIEPSMESIEQFSELMDKTLRELCVPEHQGIENESEFSKTYEAFSSKSSEFFKRYHLQKVVLMHHKELITIRNTNHLTEDHRNRELNEFYSKIIERFTNETVNLSSIKPISTQDIKHEIVRLDCTSWVPKDFFKLLDDYFDG